MNLLPKSLFLAPVITSLLALVAQPTKADVISFTLSLGNIAINSFSGPYANVSVNRTDSTHATITFSSLTAGGNIFLMGDGGTVGVNVNATSWTPGPGPITGANSGTGFSRSDADYSYSGAGNEDGFGSFNQTIKSFDGFGHSSSTVSFSLTDTSGTWASAASVLTPNAGGFSVAAHIYVTADPAKLANGALATGYAVNGAPGSGDQIPDGGTTMALLGSALAGLGILRKRICKS